MLAVCLRLACLLNDLSAGRVTAPLAEAELGELQHVHDAEELLAASDPDPIASVPIRRALAGVANRRADQPTLWGLYLVWPGHLAGLRGPAQVNDEALDAGMAVVCHASSASGVPAGTVWIPTPVGPAVQWQIRRGAPPLPPPTAPEAGQRLRAVMAETIDQLGQLGPAGRRPEAVAPRLGRGHRHSDQVLLDLAWTMLAAGDAGLDAVDQMLTAHGTRVREQALRGLRTAAAEAVCAAASWPLTS